MYNHQCLMPVMPQPEGLDARSWSATPAPAERVSVRAGLGRLALEDSPREAKRRRRATSLAARPTAGSAPERCPRPGGTPERGPLASLCRRFHAWSAALLPP